MPTSVNRNPVARMGPDRDVGGLVAGSYVGGKSKPNDGLPVAGTATGAHGEGVVAGDPVPPSRGGVVGARVVAGLVGPGVGRGDGGAGEAVPAIGDRVGAAVVGLGEVGDGVGFPVVGLPLVGATVVGAIVGAPVGGQQSSSASRTRMHVGSSDASVDAYSIASPHVTRASPGITTSGSSRPDGQKVHIAVGLSVVGRDVGLIVVGGDVGAPVVGGGVGRGVGLPVVGTGVVGSGVVGPGVGSPVGGDVVGGAVVGRDVVGGGVVGAATG